MIVRVIAIIGILIPISGIFALIRNNREQENNGEKDDAGDRSARYFDGSSACKGGQQPRNGRRGIVHSVDRSNDCLNGDG